MVEVGEGGGLGGVEVAGGEEVVGLGVVVVRVGREMGTRTRC